MKTVQNSLNKMSQSICELPLQITSLTVRRGDQNVIEGLSLSLEAGDALVIMGPNGSGKSTLMRVLAGFLPPASGEIRLGDIPYLPQDPACPVELFWYAGADGLSDQMSGIESQTLFQSLRASASERPGGDEDPFFIADIIHQPVRQLSTGQRQRLALSCLIQASASRPSPGLWLLDEPDSGLDTEGRLALEEQIDAHLNRGGRVVMVSHQTRSPLFAHRTLRFEAAS